MILEGQQVILRPIEPVDAETLAAILAEPSVARWWGTFDLERVRTDLVHGGHGEEGFVIEHDASVVGYIQVVEETEPDFRSASIDLFIRTDAQGRGLGSEAIRTLSAHLIDERGHHRLTIDPAAENHRAIRVYERLGFRPIGVMRSYQRMPDGRWIDALLMDMLADELVR
jgi:aminoglycoside 6'-N-acetyltransferase